MISSEHIITPQGLERITSQAGKWMSQKDMNHHRQANTGMIDELTVTVATATTTAMLVHTI